MRGFRSSFLVAFAFAAGVLAQDAAPPAGREPDNDVEAPFRVPEVVVTASPLAPRSLFDTPFRADSLDHEEIQLRRQSRTLPESLKEVPGITVQKTGHGQGSPFIRGFTGYRNLLMMDGIRLNSGIQRQGPNQYWALVDPFLIERLEVVQGPMVMYGSDSLGGTVVAYSREPDEFEPGVHGHERTVLRYSYGEDSWIVRQELWGNAGDFAALAGGSFKDFGDIRGGDHVGRQPNTGYDQWGGDLKLVYRTAENQRLIGAYQRTAIVEGPRTHRTQFAEPWHGTRVGTDLRLDIDNSRELAYVQYHWDEAGLFFDDLVASVSLARLFEREHRTRSSGLQEIRDFDVDTLGAFLRLRSVTPIGSLTYGADWYHDWIDSRGRDVSAAGAITRYARGVVADDTQYDLAGAFLQDEVTIGPVDLTLAGRFNYAAIDAEEVDFNPADGLVLDPIEEDWTSFVGSARAVWHVHDHWAIVGGVSQGFRVPTVHDLTAIAFKLSGTLEIPSPDLEPERTLTEELGLRVRYDRWGAEVFGFYTDLDDTIERVLGPNPFFPAFGAITANQRMNLGDGNFYGATFAADWEFIEGWTLFGDVAWTFGETQQIPRGRPKSLEPADKVNPITGHVGVRWEPEGSRWWVEALVTIVDRQERVSDSDKGDTQRIPPGGTPGFTLYTLRGGYELNEHLSASVAIENLTNKDYRWHGSGSNEPGINAIGTLEIQF